MARRLRLFSCVLIHSHSHYSTTMVQLKPEIYKMIVESMLDTEGPFNHNVKLIQQQSLARMMQASKVSSHPFLFTSFFKGDFWDGNRYGKVDLG
jgi:hypothetical protein